MTFADLRQKLKNGEVSSKELVQEKNKLKGYLMSSTANEMSAIDLQKQQATHLENVQKI